MVHILPYPGERYSTAERFQAASFMLGRGLAAPVIVPFLMAARKAAKAREDMLGLRSMLDTSDVIWMVAGAAGRGFLAGIFVGAATFAGALVEAPFQLVTPGRPQSLPWVQRRLQF